MKYNNESPYFRDWTTAKLKEEYKVYHELIYGRMSCYGVRDMMHFLGIEKELNSRGLVITTEPVIEEE